MACPATPSEVPSSAGGNGVLAALLLLAAVEFPNIAMIDPRRKHHRIVRGIHIAARRMARAQAIAS